MSRENLKPFEFKYFQDKQTIFKYYCQYMLTRTQSMFVYEGLPDTIPAQWLEYYLQRNGSCCIAEVKGELYALIGSAGGDYDVYYQPTRYVVANPALNLSADYTIGRDCVYCRNDFTAIGLVPLLARYCGLMTENVLTVRQADVSMRNMFLLSAPDDNTLASVKQFIKDLEEGKLAVVGDNPFFDGVKEQSSSHGNGDYMIQFIELQQYLKGSLYNELGINANFNMKREALSSDEVALNDDALMPLIDDMLKQRRIMCGQLKDLFGIDVSVDYGSTWHSNIEEKKIVAGSEMDADSEDATEMAGDEASLPDDEAPQGDETDDVSQLTDNNDNDQNTSETTEENDKDEKSEEETSEDETSEKEDDTPNESDDSKEDDTSEDDKSEEDSTDDDSSGDGTSEESEEPDKPNPDDNTSDESSDKSEDDEDSDKDKKDGDDDDSK